MRKHALVQGITTVLVAALVAGSTWLAYQYHRDIGRARARVATGSRVISTPCGPIEYAEVGIGSPVLTIHGAGGGFDQGLVLGAPLAAKGYRVIAASRPSREAGRADRCGDRVEGTCLTRHFARKIVVDHQRPTDSQLPPAESCQWPNRHSQF